MPGKDFKAGFKANSLNGKRITQESATVPFGYNAAQDELEREAERLPVVEIPIIQLQDNPYQHLARPQLDEQALEELAASIRENGFYGALLARRKKSTSSQYELAYGHRRKEAARRAGLVTLPVKVVELGEFQMMRIMASENFSRQDLDPLGEANVVGLLANEQNLSARQIAEMVGQGSSWVERRLALHRAPQDLKEMVAQRPDTFSLVELLAGVKEEFQRQRLVMEVLSKGLTRKQVQERLTQNSKATRIAVSGRPATDPDGPISLKVNGKIVKDVTISPLRETSEKSNDFFADGIVNYATSSPLRESGEDYHNASASELQEWQEALAQVERGMSRLAQLRQEGKLPTEGEAQVAALVERLKELLG
ncbi:MAG TPA: ParB/RepB/Spo0J family partition protein [Chloroflexia bacterium]|nr:ParB/RepB/Spo0J family partition protein [Chloroflexia bacterium]